MGTLATGLAAMGFFLTDFIDGFLARKLHAQTFFGSLLDAVSEYKPEILILSLGTFSTAWISEDVFLENANSIIEQIKDCYERKHFVYDWRQYWRLCRKE